MSSITLKRGDTFRATVTRKTSAGVPVNLTGYTVRTQLRDPLGAVVASSYGPSPTLTVTFANQTTSPGVLTVLGPAAATATWPTGALAWDLEYLEPAGDTRSSETIRLVVVPDVTQ